MVKRILQLFYGEFGGIHKAALVLAVSSAFSAGFGVLRDRMLAGHFGAGRSLDIYYAAFKVPDFFYIVLLSIVSVNALMPIFLEKAANSKEEAKKFLDEIASFFLLAIFILAVAAYFLVPYLSGIVAPGFSAESKKELVLLSRILLLSPILLGFSNLFSSAIQSYNMFIVYALSPIVYNVGIIFGIIFLYPILGMSGIVWGVVGGAAAHAAIQIPALLKIGAFPFPVWRINFVRVWQVAKLSLPRTLGLGLNQIILVFITAAGSLLSAGSIAVFNLSFNLQSVPLSVIGLSYSVAAFPTLAKLFVNNKKGEFLNQTTVAVRQIIFWSIPAAMLIIVLRAQFVRVILGASDRFDWQDTRLTAAAMAIFTLSVVAQSLVALFARAFYAAGKTWRPIIINLVSALIIVIAAPLIIKMFGHYDFILSFFEIVFRVSDVPGTKMLALPLAFSLGMIINAVWLFWAFQKEFGMIWPAVRTTFFDSLKGSLVMAAVCYFVLNILDGFLNTKKFWGIASQGLIAGVVGLTVLFFVLIWLKNKELDELIKAARHKFWKTQVVVPEPENLER